MNNIISLKQNKEHIYSLSGLKVIAILLMFWYHSKIPNPDISMGSRLCEIFFVCSGFLVFYNNARKISTPTWKDSVCYWLKKVCAMYPLHIFGFLIACLLVVRSINGALLFKAILNLSFLNVWSSNPDVAMCFNGLSWFLSVLLFCYFISPLLIWLIKKARNHYVIFGLVFLVRFGIEFVAKHYPDTVFFVLTHTNPVVRGLEFCMGMIVAAIFLSKEKKQLSKAWGTVVEIITLLVVLGIVIIGEHHLYKAVFIPVFCVLIYVFAHQSGYVSKALSNKAFMWFSGFEFEFFMTHTLFLNIVNATYHKFGIYPHWSINSVTALLVTVAFAWAYHKFIAKKATKVMTTITEKMKGYIFQ